MLSPTIPYNDPITHENAYRASDSDREQTAERLRHAAAEGRLLPEELEERLRAAFAGRTYGDLAAVVSDLPSPPTPVAKRRPATLEQLRLVLPWLVALAAALVILMAAVVVRQHASAAAQFPVSPTTATAAPQPPP